VRLLVAGGIFVEEVRGRRRLGGSGLTAALAAARFGPEVSLAGWVGAAEADETFALLDAAGVDRLGVLVLDGATTVYRIADPVDLSTPLPQLIQGAVPDAEVPALPSAGVVLCFGTPGFDVVAQRWLDRPSEGATLLFDRQGSQSAVLGARMAVTVPAAHRVLLANLHEALAETRTGSLTDAMNRLPPEGFLDAVVKQGPWGSTLIDMDRTERPIGAYDVRIHSSIGSGDVFAGAMAAGLCRGEGVAAAAVTGTAAAAAWISGDDDQPTAELPARASQLRRKTATWVDRRELDATRFTLALDPDLDQHNRERIARSLRYLGVETLHTSTAESLTLNLANPKPAGDPVTTAVMAAVALIRADFGEPVP
jgi:pfkB family carbohydrate kinase